MLIFDRFSDEKTPYDGCHTGLNAAYSLFSSSSLRFLLIIASGVPAPAAPPTVSPSSRKSHQRGFLFSFVSSVDAATAFSVTVDETSTLSLYFSP